jgi:hypothetical protein
MGQPPLPQSLRSQPERNIVAQLGSEYLVSKKSHNELHAIRQEIAAVGHKLYAAPLTVRISVIAATILLVFTAINLVYRVLRKPAEILVLIMAR